MNPFTLVPRQVRLWLYGVAGFPGFGLGAVTACGAAVALPRPTWVIGASAALAVLAAPLFAMAASNVGPQVTVAAEPPRKATPEPLDPIVSSEGVTYPQSSDTKADAADYDPRHDKN